MKQNKIALFFLLIACLLAGGCSPQADFDIRGGWQYTMTDTNGNTYDSGVITFHGDLTKGTYLEVNIYQVEYQGNFSVKGSTLQLTGYENWNGTIQDENTINGNWKHDNGESGTFTASRIKPD